MIEEKNGYKIDVKIISDYMAENNLSKSKFCKMCKISILSFDKVMSGSLNCSIIILFKIANVINVRVCEMFV